MTQTNNEQKFKDCFVFSRAFDTAPIGRYPGRYCRGCYKFVEEETTWTDAVEKCQSDNAELSVLLSQTEKDDVQQYFIANNEINDRRWWVGLTRSENTGSNWTWTENTPISTKLTPWFQNSQSTKKGELSATIELNSGRLVLRSDFRDDQEVIYPFICEFYKGKFIFLNQRHKLLHFLQSLYQITLSRRVTADSNSMDYERVIRRLHSADDTLYKQYLQSEINANVAKVAYYTRVAGLYEAALQQQNQYYESSREKLRLEIDRLNQPLTCT
nr:killer cell lectin-like receptor subfamily F member 1 [Biomphalaria glabrata]